MFSSKLGKFMVWSVGVALLAAALPAHAADWIRFRGDNGSGIVTDTNVPTTWSDSENLRWKTELPGPGFSSPIIVGDKIVVTCYTGYGLSREDPGNIENLKRHLVCIDRKSGDQLWSVTVDATLPEDPFAGPGVPAHGYASHTPTSDGEHIFAFFGKSGVMAFDLSGKQIWKTSVGTGSDPQAWGSAASLVLLGDKLIVNASAESRSLVALNKADGKEIWRTEVESLAQTWGTPIVIEGASGTELVLSVPEEIWGLNPANGKLRWYALGSEARGMATSLIADNDTVYCVGGMMGGKSVAVKTGGKGDVTDTHTVWQGRGFSQFGSAVLHEGHLYGASENGVAFCVDAATGEPVYQTRLATGEAVQAAAAGPPGGRRGGGGGGAGGRRRGGRGGMGSRSYGSALLVGDKVYYTEQSGATYVFEASPKSFQLISKNQLGSTGDGFNATPAVSDGELVIRSNKFLYCVSDQ